MYSTRSSTHWSARCGRDQQRFQFEFGPVASHSPYSEFMCISHESGHCKIKKLVVSAAIDQVLQSLAECLLRVDLLSLPCWSTCLLHRVSSGASATVSIVLVGSAGRRLATHPSTRSSLLYTPSYATHDLDSNPLSPMFPPSHR